MRILCKIESNSTEHDDFDSVDTPDESRVSLLIERHLLDGVRHFQRELKCLQSQLEPPSGHMDLPISDRILHEASAGIANLSTIKVFRVAMVRIGSSTHRCACTSTTHSHMSTRTRSPPC